MLGSFLLSPKSGRARHCALAVPQRTIWSMTRTDTPHFRIAPSKQASGCPQPMLSGLVQRED